MANRPRVDTKSRVINATPDAVYQAWLDANALATWLPPADMTGEVLAFEPREGGRYRMALRYNDCSIEGKTAGNADIVEGRFAKLRPNQRIVQQIEFESSDPAFAGTMTMTWLLTPVSSGTEVTITAANVPPGIRPEDHEAGMASTLANLAKFVE